MILQQALDMERATGARAGALVEEPPTPGTSHEEDR